MQAVQASLAIDLVEHFARQRAEGIGRGGGRRRVVCSREATWRDIATRHHKREGNKKPGAHGQAPNFGVIFGLGCPVRCSVSVTLRSISVTFSPRRTTSFLTPGLGACGAGAAAEITSKTACRGERISAESVHPFLLSSAVWPFRLTSASVSMPHSASTGSSGSSRSCRNNCWPRGIPVLRRSCLSLRWYACVRSTSTQERSGEKK